MISTITATFVTRQDHSCPSGYRSAMTGSTRFTSASRRTRALMCTRLRPDGEDAAARFYLVNGRWFFDSESFRSGDGLT